MTERRVCAITGESFELTQEEADFCRERNFPLPELSRSERFRELMATRNEWKLYRRKCDFTGDEILSAYPPDSPFTVYKNTVWWGGGWDARQYGRTFDFSRPFFEQFAELQKAVPRDGTSIFNSENCDYNSHIRESKNCYLNSLIVRCEDVLYSYWVVGDKDTLDSMYTNESTLCYWCADVNKSYGCVMLEESDNCSDCHFSFQLRGCHHCLFSANLSNKSYYLFNKPCTPDEFESAKQRFLDGSWKNWEESRARYLEFRGRVPHRCVHNLNCENVRGDHLFSCRDCDDCYESFNSESSVNAISLSAAKLVQNGYSVGWPGNESIYRCAVMRGNQDCAFCTYTWFSGSMRYCDACNASESCFGCIGLHHQKYCILNKQYTKEEYEALVPKVIEHMRRIGEWGRFFTPGLSPFAYNETAAMDFMPLAESEARQRGYRWRPQDSREYQPATLAEIPDNIKDVSDSITGEVLACADCRKNYKITPQELKFYRNINLPIPRRCSACRHRQRFSLHNPLRLFARKCAQCGGAMESSYAPDRSETVYCEACYLKAVY